MLQMCFFYTFNYLLSDIKGLLNYFQNPLPQTESFRFSNEKKIGEWSVEGLGGRGEWISTGCFKFAIEY